MFPSLCWRSKAAAEDRDAAALARHLADADREAEALNSTLFRLAQYFGWTEILRREVEFLQFSEDEETRAAWEALTLVSRAFASDRYAEGTSFMLWAEEQRGIGERMIVTDGATSRCIGYATLSISGRRSSRPCLHDSRPTFVTLTE